MRKNDLDKNETKSRQVKQGEDKKVQNIKGFSAENI
jgi:hypothetical protein